MAPRRTLRAPPQRGDLQVRAFGVEEGFVGGARVDSSTHDTPLTASTHTASSTLAQSLHTTPTPSTLTSSTPHTLTHSLHTHSLHTHPSTLPPHSRTPCAPHSLPPHSLPPHHTLRTTLAAVVTVAAFVLYIYLNFDEIVAKQKVGRRRLTISKSVLQAPVVSELATM